MCFQVSSESLRTNRQITESNRQFVPTFRTSHSKRPWTPLCPVSRHNEITSSQTRTTHNSCSAKTGIRKIGRRHAFQTLEHKQTDLVKIRWGYGSQCKSIRTGAIWSNRQGHESNVRPNSTQTEAAVNETKAASEEHYYNSPADYEPMLINNSFSM